jgi:hypothetical protein
MGRGPAAGGEFADPGRTARPSSTQTLLVKSKTRGKAVLRTTFENQKDHGVPLVIRMPRALKIGHRDLTNRVCCGETPISLRGRH